MFIYPVIPSFSYKMKAIAGVGLAFTDHISNFPIPILSILAFRIFAYT